MTMLADAPGLSMTIKADDPKQCHLDAHAGFAEAARGPSWLRDVRERAIRVFGENGFPARKAEAWRYTNIRPVTGKAFALASGDVAAAQAFVNEFGFTDQAAAQVVLVDGRINHELSDLDGLPQGIAIFDLIDSTEDHQLTAEVQQHLGRYADVEKNPFVALNTAFLGGGVYIKVNAGTAVDLPIHVLSISTGVTLADEPAVAYPRLLVVAGDKAEFSLVETYCGPEDTVYFACPVTEIIAGADCRIDHNKLNAEGRSGLHIATMETSIGARTVFVDHSCTIGSRLTRNDLNVHLNGDAADATLSGVMILTGDQHCDNHTLLDHQYPNCPSFELYKHVLDGQASGIFKGQIYVAQKAQKTDSKQSSRSLLLSDTATMQSQPALEIYADDVKCTHGSTTGPLDDSAVFYLNSRGVSSIVARRLLTYAFAADVTRRIKIAPVRERVEGYMAKHHGLPTDFRIQDLAEATESVVF